MNRALSAIDGASEHAGRWASLLLLPMTLVTLLEMVLRYFFNAPTIWASESAQYLFGYIFLLGGAYTLKHNGHIRVEVLSMRLPERGQVILNLLSYPFTLLFLLAVVYFGSEKAWGSVVSLERSFSVWEPYLFPALVAVPIGAGLMTLQCAAMLIRDIRRAFHPRGDEPVVETGIGLQ